jgi:hypothetical protein
VQPQVGPSLGPNNRRPGRAQREPRPTTRREAKRLHFVTRCTASGTRKLGRIHHSSSRFQTAHLVPAPRFLRPGLATLLRQPESRGGRSAERRSGACEAPVGRAVLRHKTRVNALMTRHARRLARRLASHDAGRSPLGAPPWRFFTRGRASVSLGARRPTTAGSCLRLRAASSSQPGRSAWRATSRASRGERLRAARRGTPLPAPPSGSSLEDAPR